MGEERGVLSDMLQYAQRIQVIAQSGLTFSTDTYDQERYEELQTIAFEMMATATTESIDEIRMLYGQESGYATPKIDIRGGLLTRQIGCY